MTIINHLDVHEATPADTEVLERLWQLFRHDMSAVDGALPDRHGRFREERLRSAVGDASWKAHLALWDGRPVAFSFVRGTDEAVRVMNSFFVVRAARGHRVGRSLAWQVIRAFPGRWEIPFQETNRPAAAFWPQVATEVAGTEWALERRPVPGRPDLPPDAWITLVAR